MTEQGGLFHVLKYRAQLDKIADCCPATNVSLPRVMFRWTFSPMDKRLDFRPGAVIYPSNPYYTADCRGWALSIFVSDTAAKKTYAS